MKTKNIFRAFLMAVALFMGIGSVQAVETTVWETGTTADYTIVEISKDKFGNVAAGMNMRIYATIADENNWGMIVQGAWSDSFEFINWKGDSNGKNINKDHLADIYNATDKYFEMTLSTKSAEILKDHGAAIHEWGVIFQKITIVDSNTGGGSDEPATPQTYSVTVTSGIANGSITANPTSAKEGDQVTLTITPNSGYELDWVNVKDANGGDITVTDNKFDMPASNVTVSGAFKKSTVKANITSSTGYATFCSNKALDFSGVSGLKAYYAKSVSEEGMVVFEQVTGTVAAGTGLLLHGTTADIPVATGTGNAITGNLLKGATTTIYDLQKPNCYVLTVENEQVKFASTKLTAAKVYEGHAYLELPTSNNQSRLMISFVGESTGIEDATLIGQEENVYYDLRGMRVEKPTHGIYIVNGKKVFVK